MNDFISRKRERRTPQFSARAPKAPRGEISRACALVVDTSDSHAAGGLVDLGRPFGPRTVPSFCGAALRGGSLTLHRCVEQVELAGDSSLFCPTALPCIMVKHLYPCVGHTHSLEQEVIVCYFALQAGHVIFCR